METLWMALRVILSIYLGVGLGFQLNLFRMGRTVHYRNKEGKYIKVDGWLMALYIPTMGFLWPTYYTKLFRTWFKIPGMW